MDFMIPIWCCADGNCFWYSISNLLLGSDEYFFVIKVCSIFMLLEYRSEIDKILKRYDYDVSLETFIENSMKVNEFSNELNIFATCIATNRPVYSFGGEFSTHMIYSQKYELEYNKSNRPLKLAYEGNHFVALLSKEKNFNQKKIENEMLFELKKKIKMKNYD
jgi:hypothetical protein